MKIAVLLSHSGGFAAPAKDETFGRRERFFLPRIWRPSKSPLPIPPPEYRGRGLDDPSISPSRHPAAPPSRRLSVSRSLHLSILLLTLLVGCGQPNQENIRLRKLNQDLDAKANTLSAKIDADQRTIDGLYKRIPTIPILPADELKKLWVTAGLKVGSLSGGAHLDMNKPYDEGLTLYVCPTDENDTPIQAAGSFTIEAFDLANKGDTHLGKWTWNSIEAKSQWRAFLLERDYVLTCPWQKVPTHPDITVRIIFTDELTHIDYHAETVLHVKLPTSSATAPTSAPSL